MILAQIPHRDLFRIADGRTDFEYDAAFLEPGYLSLKQLSGNGFTELTAQAFFLFVDDDGVTAPSHEVGGRKTCGTGSDDGYRTCPGDVWQSRVMFENPVPEIVFHRRDVDGGVDLFAGAGSFAEMRADSAGEQREGVVLQQFVGRIGMTTLLQQVHIAAHIDTSGAGRAAGRGLFLVCIQAVNVK